MEIWLSTTLLSQTGQKFLITKYLVTAASPCGIASPKSESADKDPLYVLRGSYYLSVGTASAFTFTSAEKDNST